ncbi:MAG TPA: hypothetical protein VJN18_05395 [Polyangiaceae bacterium]|nr:hypothetical protein [Polyangiaceae bacterium]
MKKEKESADARLTLKKVTLNKVKTGVKAGFGVLAECCTKSHHCGLLFDRVTLVRPVPFTRIYG